MTIKVKHLYDSLFSAEQKRRTRGRIVAYPVHKKVTFDDPSIEDSSQWIARNISLPARASILDAGCGTGYTLISLCRNTSFNGLGISVSEREVHYAQQVVNHIGLQQQCTFKVASFDQPLSRKFDLIIAIESLKHAESFEFTLNNLIHHLKVNGQFVLIEDFAMDDKAAFLGKQIKKYWAVNEWYTVRRLTQLLNRRSDIQYSITDLTPNIAFRDRCCLNVQLGLLFLFTKLVHFFQKGNALSTFFAGLCLEQLYNKKRMRYLAIHITRTA